MRARLWAYLAFAAALPVTGCRIGPSSANGQTCAEDFSCASGHCIESVCNAFGADGTPCAHPSDCKSNQCDLGTTGVSRCLGSRCACGQAQCANASSTDCNAGWSCAYVTPGSDFLGNSYGGVNRCFAPCGEYDGGELSYQCIADAGAD